MTELHELSPTAAHALLQTSPHSILVDIRSAMEYLFVGHPVGSVHIAWIDEPDWEVNPHFANEIEQLLASRFKEIPPKTAQVILICRSGKRSREAANALLDAGFQHVMHINEGFEGERDEQQHRSTLGGWRFHGLPWEQC
ncbi:MAG: rhodanese-like domain-containing protein [Candidatus Thiothrix sulfatifontis]|nr:MAG: rhodanese-like domain-containing protein [Candidatus Thiothrix sulfatifontis]